MTVQRGGAFAAAQAGEADAPTPCGVRDALRAATVGGALAAALESEIGTLVPGAKADLTVLSLDRLRPVASNIDAAVAHIASERPWVRPTTSARSDSSRAPAWPTTDLPSAVTLRRGRLGLRFSFKVPSWLGCYGVDNRSFPFQGGVFTDLPPLSHAAY